MTEPLLDLEELCPSCGHFAILNDTTGFCADCSKPYLVEELCKCGRRRRQQGRCCYREAWYDRNADRIEELISTGLTLGQAKERVISEDRAICVICLESIPGRIRANTIFCTRRPECRSATRRFRYLKEEKGMTEAQALTEVLEELG